VGPLETPVSFQFQERPTDKTVIGTSKQGSIDEGRLSYGSWTVYPDQERWWDPVPLRHGKGTTYLPGFSGTESRLKQVQHSPPANEPIGGLFPFLPWGSLFSSDGRGRSDRHIDGDLIRTSHETGEFFPR